MEKISPLLEKYDNFKYAQLRSVQQLLDGSKILTIAVQDDDGEDLNTVEVEFKNINDSKILVDSVLSYLDMTSGISLIKENNLYGFAIGSASSMVHVHSAPLFIIASDIQIVES
ncbi:MAG: hypothetical protein ACI9TV_000964 [Sulfurimonas sp.]|jgi:hypothetical protein|uniref:hypothetical protein n=1 Tax=Sulfurimonas sp. TaxID=2022749 RepID=UPI0039E22FFB